MRKLIGILLFFCLLNLGFSTDYYVKNGGDDSKSGLDDTNAWETIAKVNGETFSGDDNIYFNKGDTWRETLIPPSSGTSGHPITFGAYGSGDNPKILGSTYFGDSGDWTSIGGNEWATANNSFPATTRRAVFYNTNATPGWCILDATPDTNWEHRYDATNDRAVIYHDVGNPADQTDGIEIGARANAIYSSNKDYIIIDGIDYSFTRIDGIFCGSDVNDWTFKNFTVSYTRGHGIKTYLSTGSINADNVTSEYCGEHGIFFDEPVAGTIENCTSHDSGQSRSDFWWHALCITGAENLTVQDNTFYNAKLPAARGGSGIGGDGYKNCIFQNNTIYDTRQPGIDLTGVASGCYGNIVRYNKIYNIKYNIWYGCIQIRTDTQEDGRYTSNNEIYYNLFYDSKVGLNIHGECHDNEIYNNVIYNCEKAYTITDDGTYEPSGNLFKNNIIHTSDDYFVDVASGFFPSNTCDYNCYYDTNLNNKWVYEGNRDTLAAWQSASSQGANSLNADPQLVNPTSDFHLGPTSTCIEAGVDVGLTEDYDGTAVPQDTYPEIGAEEYESGNGNGSGGICPESFTDYKIITVQGGNLSNNQTNVPVMFKSKAGGDTDIGAGTDSIEDIWFYTDATPPVKLSWNPVYYNNAAGTATFIYFVNCSPLADGSSTYRAYYGNTSAADGSDSGGTYNANYKGVWHMDAATGDETDSSGNSNTIVETGGTIASTTGKVYNARDFELDDTEYFLIADGSQTGLDITGDISMSVWLDLETLPNANGVAQTIANKYIAGTTNASYEWFIEDSDDKLRIFYSEDGSGTNKTEIRSATAITTALTHVAIAVDVSAKSCTYWFNGSSESGVLVGGTHTSIADKAAPFVVGARSAEDSRYVDGIMDELRIYSGLYPTGWVAFEHANMNEADNELTWGSETSCDVSQTTSPIFHGLNFLFSMINIF